MQWCSARNLVPRRCTSFGQRSVSGVAIIDKSKIACYQNLIKEHLKSSSGLDQQRNLRMPIHRAQNRISSKNSLEFKLREAALMVAISTFMTLPAFKD